MIVSSMVAGEVDGFFIIGMVLITGLGIVDDRFGLSPGLRLFAELAIAALIAVRWLDLGVGYMVAGIVVVVVAVNAVNLYDGLDLLAGSTGLVGLLVLAWASLAVGGSPWPALGLAAALAGFLPYNRPPARVFLGDGGAYLLGAVTAVALVDLGAEAGPAGVVASLGFLGMFALDLIITVIRRKRVGHPLFEGDRSHLYDRLRDQGRRLLSVVGALVAAHAVIVTLCAMAIVALPAVWAAVSIAALGTIGLGVFWPISAGGPAGP